MNTIYKNIIASAVKSENLLAVLIDPDKMKLEMVSSFISKVNQSIATHVFVGGSEVGEGVTKNLVIEVKKHTTVPVVLFPGDVAAVVPSVTVVLFPGYVAAAIESLKVGTILGGVARDGAVRLALWFRLAKMGFTVVSQLEGGAILKERVIMAVIGWSTERFDATEGCDAIALFLGSY